MSLKTPQTLSSKNARALLIQAQCLDTSNPFGRGPSATSKAVAHLGYVQIDTISVIERCHHHILFNRIPSYRRQDLHRSLSQDKTVFEYWTHALAYVPSADFRYFMAHMKRVRENPNRWYSVVKPEEMQKVIRLIKKEGPISIRDIIDDVLIEKDHDWASRKPSKRALQFGFSSGQFTVSERVGMLKKYDLVDRHFDWSNKPKMASPSEVCEYLLDRALRSQALISLDSAAYLDSHNKAGLKNLIQSRVKEGSLISVQVKGAEKMQLFMKPELLESAKEIKSGLTHLLSPFDPLVIQRKRLKAFFDYEHRFEAYIPKEKRIYGYFALPVLMDDQIVAVLDLKTDRTKKKLLIQQWTWLQPKPSKSSKKRIEEELHRFEKFQLQAEEPLKGV